MATETWTAPALDTIYICYDENDVPCMVGRYVDMLSEIESDIWPKSQKDYDLLMWAYNAEPVHE